MLSTYGRIALASQSNPRYVAKVLAGLSQSHDLPWHRIINSMGKISVHPNAGGSSEQRRLLECEGHHFEPSGVICHWKEKLHL